MERNYNITLPTFVDTDELHWRTAFHEAGHAAAIHILNRQKKLPPVFFEIQVKRPKADRDDFLAKVIDGNLIQNLPMAIVESMSSLTESEQQSCQRALEADVVNLLVGPLSEAKYVARRDGEILNPNLVNLNALRHYGGHSDIENVRHYLEHIARSKADQDSMLMELLRQAYQFIDNYKNWECIAGLAHFILESQQEIISCDEAIKVLDRSLKATQHRGWSNNIVSFSGR